MPIPDIIFISLYVSLQSLWLLPHCSERLLLHMEADRAPRAQVVLLCQSHHAAYSLLHPRYPHPPLAPGTHRPADGENMDKIILR